MSAFSMLISSIISFGNKSSSINHKPDISLRRLIYDQESGQSHKHWSNRYRIPDLMKWKCVNFKCYSSEELITLNTLHEVVPTWYSFHSWVDWSNADKASCSRRKHIDAGIEPSTFVSKVDILSTTPIVHMWPMCHTIVCDQLSHNCSSYVFNIIN